MMVQSNAHNFRCSQIAIQFQISCHQTSDELVQHCLQDSMPEKCFTLWQPNSPAYPLSIHKCKGGKGHTLLHQYCIEKIIFHVIRILVRSHNIRKYLIGSLNSAESQNILKDSLTPICYVYLQSSFMCRCPLIKNVQDKSSPVTDSNTSTKGLLQVTQLSVLKLSK